MRIIDKNTNCFIRDGILPENENEIVIDAPLVKGFYKAKWNGEAWEEAGTPPDVQPQEPTESERLEALEMLMVDILGGGF